MGELEDRCIRVFVDGDDEARILDAQFVLDSTGNAQSDVNLRSNFLARNADLPFIRRPFFIDEGFGNAESCADALGKGLDRFHTVFGLDTAAGTDDDISRRDSQFFRFFFDRFKTRYRDGRSDTGEIDAFLDDFASPGRICRRAVENLVADRSQLRPRRRLDLDEELARISRTDPGQGVIVAFKADVRAVSDQADTELSRQAAAEVAAIGRPADEDDTGFIFFSQSGDGFGVQDGIISSQRAVFDSGNGIGPVGNSFLAGFRRISTGDKSDDFLALGISQLTGFAQQFNAQRAQGTAGDFDIYADILFQFHNSALLTASSWQSDL